MKNELVILAVPPDIFDVLQAIGDVDPQDSAAGPRNCHSGPENTTARRQIGAACADDIQSAPVIMHHEHLAPASQHPVPEYAARGLESLTCGPASAAVGRERVGAELDHE